jgi:hypothetical protein
MNRSSRSANQLFLVLFTEQGRGVSSCPDSLTNLDHRVRAALDQSGLPAFLPLSGKLAHQVMSARAYKLERAPARTNDSPTTLRACSSARGPGLLHQGVPPQASPPRPVAAEGERALTVQLPQELEVAHWLGVAANAIRGKTSDAHWPKH